MTWLVNGRTEQKYIGVKTDTHVIVNRLEVPRITRDHLNTTFKCRATNTHLVPPQEKSVRLEMNCKYFIDPLSRFSVRLKDKLENYRMVSYSGFNTTKSNI